MYRLLTLLGLFLTTGVFAQVTTSETRVATPKTKTAKTSSVNINEKKLPILIIGQGINFVIEDDIMKEEGQENLGNNEEEVIINQGTGSNSNISTEESGQIAKTNQQILEENINIFPLPAKDYFNISIDKSSIEDLTLINSNGQVVFNEANTNEQSVIRIDTNQLTKGIYFVILNTSNGRISKSILIQ